MSELRFSLMLPRSSAIKVSASSTGSYALHPLGYHQNQWVGLIAD